MSKQTLTCENKKTGSVFIVEFNRKLSHHLPVLRDLIWSPYELGKDTRRGSDAALKRSGGNFGLYVHEIGKIHGRRAKTR
jgi:hypothetical protein